MTVGAIEQRAPHLSAPHRRQQGHMMPADLKRLHKYMLDVEHIGIISDEMREVVEELWPELAHKLPPKKRQGWLRVRRERPRGRSTAEYGDEIAPFHCPMSPCFRPKG